MSRGARIAWLLVALAAIAGIGFSYAAGPFVPTPPGLRLLRFSSFFTISTNALVAWAAIGLALPPGRGWHDRAARPAVGGAVTLYILVVALIFHLLLGNMVRPGLSGWLGNMLVHQAAPAGWLLCWLAFGRHGGLDARAPLRWMAWPLAYTGWTLAHGAASGWYPYPFLDAAALGYPAALRNIALVALVFLGLGHALRGVDARLARQG